MPPIRTQAISGINYLVNRLYTYPITERAKEAEMNTIQNVLCNNDDDINLISKLPLQEKQKQYITYRLTATKSMWVIFTYSGKEVRAITKLFRDTEMKVAFRMWNTVQNILRPQPQIDIVEVEFIN
jgi:hypothetical protein